jgi:hypothetical protein
MTAKKPNLDLFFSSAIAQRIRNPLGEFVQSFWRFINRLSRRKTMAITGHYHEHGYEILSDDDQIYAAGNNPYDSGVSQTLRTECGRALPLRKLRSFCVRTAREMALERKEKYNGSQRA